MERILADEFINLYPVSKTLRFELKPIGKTLEYIERDGVIDTDIARSENYSKVKAYIDEYHKAFIQKVLDKMELQNLNCYYQLYNIARRSDKEEKEFDACQTDLRKQISQSFKDNPAFKTINKKELIKNDLTNFYAEDEDKLSLINSFSDFTTYFTGFHQNRQNILSFKQFSTIIVP